VGKGVAQTLDTGMQQYTLKDARIRRLTPIECERLQGFPDNWTQGVSDSQRYKCLGNAVTVNVIEYLVKKLWS
jgi:site-specific DNA-cytosine methylase